MVARAGFEPSILRPPSLHRPLAAHCGVARRAVVTSRRRLRGRAGAAQRRVVPRPGMAQLGAIAALVLSFLAAAFLSAIHKIEEGHIGVYYR